MADPIFTLVGSNPRGTGDDGARLSPTCAGIRRNASGIRHNASGIRDTEIVFIDTTLTDWESLREAIPAGIDVVLMEPGADGVAVMAQALAARRGLRAIHVLSHGFPGGLQLGRTRLNGAALSTRVAEVASFGRSLSRDGGILLYGCNVASGAGAEFLGALAEATGARIAASSTPVGAAELGGNWDLDWTHGPVPVASLAFDGYRGVLAQPSYASAAGYIGEQFFTVTLNTALDAANPPLLSAFNVQVNGTSVSVSAVSISGQDVILTINSYLLAGDIIDFSYTDPTGSNDVRAIQAIDGTDAASFTNSAIVAITRPGPAAPSGLALTAASNSGSTSDTITKVTTPAITGTALPSSTVVLYDGASAVGTATASGSGLWTITASTLSQGTHTLTAKVSNGTGTSPASAALTVTVDTAAPSLVSAVLNGTLLTLTYSEALDGSSPAASAFAVSVGGAARTVNSVATSGKTVTLALDAGATTYQPVTVGYTPPGSGAVTADAAGNAADAINGRTVKVVGDPNFTLEATNPFGLTYAVAFTAPIFGDIDGDGDLDLLVGTGTTSNYLIGYRNVGTATQPSFTLIGSYPFGVVTTGQHVKPALLDIDGDGDLDLLFGNNAGNLLVYRNVGTTAVPSFTLVGTNPFGLGTISSGFAAPAIADLDGDGDLDLLIGNKGGDVLFYRNVGTTAVPSFTLVGTNPFGLAGAGANTYAKPTSVDIDGDGDLDLLIGDKDGNVLFYRNVGTTAAPSFTLVGTNPFGLTNAGMRVSPTFVDIDGDGDLDVLAGGQTGSLTLYRNGPPAPTAPTGLNLAAGSNSGSTADQLTNVAAPTITGSAAANATVVLYDGATAIGTATADGSGLWTVTSASLNDGAHSLTAKASDTNGTSAASTALTVTIDKTAPSLVSAVLNGTLLTLTYSEPLDGSAAAAAAFAVSVGGAARTVGSVVTSGKTVTLALDAGATAGQSVTVGYSPSGSVVVTADAAGNAAGALTGRTVKVVSDPNFNWEVANPFGLAREMYAVAPAFVDIDGDGDVDAFLGTINGNTLFYRNVGTTASPSFTLVGTNPFGLPTINTPGTNTVNTFADIDGDGDLDVLIGNGTAIIAYRNVGTTASPSFTLVGTNPFGLGTPENYAAPALADIDGDGDLDLLVGGASGNMVFYRNVGTTASPSFTLAGTNPFGLVRSGANSLPVFADIDGDGDLDLFAGSADGNTYFYRNVGTTASPSFTLAGTNPFNLTSSVILSAPAVVDIDGDGDLDMLIGSGFGSTVLYRNTPPNTAPVLDASKSPALTSAPVTSTTNPVGTVGSLVSDLVGLGSGLANVIDPNGGAVTGIAITATDTSHGILWYTTNGGTTWNSVNGGTAVSGTNSLLLKADANTRLYFQVTDTTYTGTIASAFTFRAWDQTSGTAGTKVNTTTNGGTTAFSTDTDTVSITITPVGPKVTDPNIAISGGTGTGGAYRIGDTVTVTWNNSVDGDNNTDSVSSVTVNFSQFGGGTAVAASSDANGVWTAKYVVTSGSVDATNRNVSVSATDSSGTTTAADTTNATVDNIAPVLTLGNMAGLGTATGANNTLRIGDTVTAVWDNSGSGDNNPDTIGAVTADFSQFGGGTAVAMTNDGGVWRQTYVITAGNIDAANRNVAITVTDNAGNTTTVTDNANRKVDNVAPTVTDANLSISGGTGTGGAYKIGDTVTAVWNNTASGDNNADTISTVTMDFSQFGGGSAVTATSSAGTWTARYTITAGSVDATNRNVSVKAIDNAGNTTTTADTTNATVDNLAPAVTDARIGIGGATGTGGAYRIGDTVTVTWAGGTGGDNNTDTISTVTMDFSAFGGGTAVTASSAAGGTWTATYVIAAGSIDATNRNVSVTATDNAGNATTTADSTNATVDNVAPTVTDAKVSISGGTGTGGAYRIGDTVTATWNNGLGGDNNTDTISTVTMDFSAFGGGTAVTASSAAGGTWTATYVIAAGSIDATNRNVSVTATDNAGNATTTADSTNATVDNVAPKVTDANITAGGGTGGAVRVGDTVTVTWNNTASGDNNTDVISAVTVDFSQFGGGTAVAAASDANGVWTATYVIAADAAHAANRNVSVTATDNAGNSWTTADSSNLTVANTAPVLDPGKSPVLVSVLSTSTGAPGGVAGTLVSDLIATGGAIGSVTDPDGGAVTGIALTATDTSHGVWWYSTDGGANWATVNGGGAVSATNALLLKADANTRLYLQLTDGSFAGNLPTAITFRAWDQTSGTAGSKVNATTNGGSTAFSADSDTASITIDPGAPGSAPSLAAASDSGSSSSDRLTNATAVTVSGAGVAANSTVRLYGGSTLVATATANGSGAYQFSDVDVSGLTGATGFTVRQVVGGTESADSAPLTVTFDRDRPTVSIATISADDRLSGTEAGSALVITGTSTAEVGQTVSVGLNGRIYTGSVVAGGSWTVTVGAADLGGLGNEAYTVTADVADAAGNAATQATRALTVDKTAPAVAITSTALSNFAAPVLAGAAEAGSAVTVTVAGATYATTADGNGGWSVDLATATPSAGTLALDTNGTNAVSVMARDTAGNVSAPVTQTLTIDTTAPGAPAITSAALTNKAAPVLAGTAEAGSAITVTVGGATYTTTATGGTWSVDLATATPAAGTLALNANGTNAVSATARDAAGNVSASGTQSLVIDTALPNAPAITSAALTNSITPVIGGTAEAGSSITVTVGGATYSTTAANGGWSIDLATASPTSGTLALDTNGANAVSATARDAAGNVSAPVTQTLTIDTTAPVAPAVTSAALTSKAAPVLAGTAEAGSTLTVTVGGATYTTTATGGAWSIDLATDTPSAGTLALNANGANAVSATARDAAGNVSSAGAQSLVIDTTAPTATVLFEDDSIDAVEQSNSAFVISNGEAGAAYNWTITSSGGGQVSGSGVLGVGTTRVGGLNLSGLGDGTLSVALSLTDAAGNISQPLGATTRKLTATVDKPAPVAPPAEQTVDGAKVGGSITVGANGGRTTTVRIDAPTAGRQEDSNTPNATLADVPVVQEQVVDARTGAVSTVATLTVSVQTGVAATAAGSAERHTAADSLAGLIAAIEERTDAGSPSRTGLTSGGTGFLSALTSQAQLLVRSIDFSTPDGTAGQSVQTRVTGGALGGNGQSSTTPTAVVLNTTGVNAPMTIQLDNVQFAAVIGNATLVGGDGEQVVYGDAGRQWLYLGAGDDELHGGAGDDTVASAGGNDTLFGDDGNDVVMGGEGDDWVLGGAGDDLIGGGTGNDRGFGGTGNDILFGEEGDDTLTGEAGNDTVVGGAGNDLLFGEDGADFLVGEAGNDTLNAGAGNDTALGGDGRDLIGLGEGNDLAGGDAGDDTLFGEGGNDTLLGGAGNDLLNGGAGDDLLFADGGADTLWGGDGRDVFAFGRSSGGTVVMDFQVGVDSLAFYDATIDLGAVVRSARVEGGNTTLDIGGGNRITIVGQTGAVTGWFG